MAQIQGASAPLGRSDVAVVGGGVVGVACALELARRGVSVTCSSATASATAARYGNAGWLTPSLAVPLPAPGSDLEVVRWMLDPESPLYIQPRARSALAALAGRVSARLAALEVRARRRGAGRAVPRQRRSLGSARRRVGRAVRLRAARAARGLREPPASFEAARGPSSWSPARACASSVWTADRGARARAGGGRAAGRRATSFPTMRTASRIRRCGRWPPKRLAAGVDVREEHRGVRRSRRARAAAPTSACRRRAASCSPIAWCWRPAPGRSRWGARSACACRSWAPRATRWCCRGSTPHPDALV